MIYVIVVMGVSGSGKSTVGKALAKALNGTFYDGDDYHSAENIAKMSSGTPLTDEDRGVWLDQLRDIASKHIAQKELAVIACSALKQTYRNRLRVHADHTLFVYLKGSYDLIWERMQSREQHYMKPEMLQSQFTTLEEPDAKEAITVAINQDIDEIVNHILQLLE